MAQNLIGLTELKVELGGTVDGPVLSNNSANNIIGYVLRVESDTRITALRCSNSAAWRVTRSNQRA
jgi:hypothetical protein